MASVSPTPQQRGKENKPTIIFSKKYVIELVEKERYSEILGEEINIKEAKVNEKEYNIRGDKPYEEILESLKAKVEVLKYITDDTYDALKEEILRDVLELMWKLEKRNHY